MLCNAERSMDTDKLNNLNTLPLNIACESVLAPSEEDNNLDQPTTTDSTDHNIDQKNYKPVENKQNFRDLLQDRVLKRLQEKAEYGKRNINSPDEKINPPLKRYFSNEDLWKRVENRVAAKKATLTGKDETLSNDNEHFDDNKCSQEKSLKSSSTEDIKCRIRSMSKAIGLASSIQSQMKSNDFGKGSNCMQQPKRNTGISTQSAEFLNPVQIHSFHFKLLRYRILISSVSSVSFSFSLVMFVNCVCLHCNGIPFSEQSRSFFRTS